MSKIQLNLPELGSMSREQLLEECERWRKNAPNLFDQLNLLMRFKHFAPTPEDLDRKIKELDLTHQGTIELQNKQIDELNATIQYLKNDPLGIDRKFKKPTKTSIH